MVVSHYILYTILILRLRLPRKLLLKWWNYFQMKMVKEWNLQRFFDCTLNLLLHHLFWRQHMIPDNHLNVLSSSHPLLYHSFKPVLILLESIFCLHISKIPVCWLVFGGFLLVCWINRKRMHNLYRPKYKPHDRWLYDTGMCQN